MEGTVVQEMKALPLKNSEHSVRGVAEGQGDKAAIGTTPKRTKLDHVGDPGGLHEGALLKFGHQQHQQPSSQSAGDTMTLTGGGGGGSLRSRSVKAQPHMPLSKTSFKSEPVQDDYLMRLLGKGTRTEGPTASGKLTRGSLPSGLSAATQTVIGTSPSSPGTFRVPEPKFTSAHYLSSNQLAEKQQTTMKQDAENNVDKANARSAEPEAAVLATQAAQTTQEKLAPASPHRQSLPSMGWSYAETERYVGQEIAAALRSAVVSHQISYIEQLYDLHRATAVQKLLVQNCPEIEYVVEEATRALKKSLARGKRGQGVQQELDEEKEYLHPDSQFAAAPHRDKGGGGETGDNTGGMTGDGSGDDADGGSGGSGANGSGGGSTSPQPHQNSGPAALPVAQAGGHGAVMAGMQRPQGPPDGGVAGGAGLRSWQRGHAEIKMDSKKTPPTGIATRSPHTHGHSHGHGHAHGHANGNANGNGHHHQRTRGTHTTHPPLAGAPSGASQTPTNTNGTAHTANRQPGPQLQIFPQMVVPQSSSHAAHGGPALQFAPGPMPGHDPMAWWYQTYYGRPMIQQYVAVPNAAGDNRNQHPVPVKWWQDPVMTFGGPVMMDTTVGDGTFQGGGCMNSNGNGERKRHAQNNGSLVETGAAEADSLPQNNTVANGASGEANGRRSPQSPRSAVIVRPARRARKRKPSDPIDEASSGTTGQDHHPGPHANMQTQQDERKGGMGLSTSVSKGQTPRGRRSGSGPGLGPVGADANDAAQLLLSFSSKGVVDLPK